MKKNVTCVRGCTHHISPGNRFFQMFFAFINHVDRRGHFPGLGMEILNGKREDMKQMYLIG